MDEDFTDQHEWEVFEELLPEDRSMKDRTEFLFHDAGSFIAAHGVWRSGVDVTDEDPETWPLLWRKPKAYQRYRR
jgi:hypothetical protein